MITEIKNSMDGIRKSAISMANINSAYDAAFRGIENTIIICVKTKGKGVRESKRVVAKSLAINAKNAKAFKAIGNGVAYLTIGLDVYGNAKVNYQNGDYLKMASDAVVDTGFGVGGIVAGTLAGGAFGGPVGAVIEFSGSLVYFVITDMAEIKGKTFKEHTKDFVYEDIVPYIVENPPITIPYFILNN